MKKYIILILCTLTAYTLFSQATIESGHLNSNGVYEFESSSKLKETFTWKYLKSDSTVNCFIQKTNNEYVDVLSWRFIDVDIKDESTTFLVKSKDGILYFIDFLKDGKLVVILNTETDDYSAMTGDGVYYTRKLD